MMSHRLSRWSIVVLAALLIAPANLGAMISTPVAADTQLYVSPAARLTARIPVDWTSVASPYMTYAGGEGLITSFQTLATASTLDEACDDIGDYLSVDSSFTISEATWHNEPACEIDIPHPNPLVGSVHLSAMVILHPAPFEFRLETISFVVIALDADHFHDVLSTVSFDLSALTGPEIAHVILDYAEANSFYTDDIDWGSLRAEANALASDSPGRIPIFVNWHLIPALRAAGDNHSFLLPVLANGTANEGFLDGFPSGQPRGSLGYLNLPSGALQRDAQAYVEAGLDTITDLDATNVCGWIVDLRGNYGGRASIMLQVLAPFFPEGNIVGFMAASGEEHWVTREGDQILYEGETYGAPGMGRVPVLSNAEAPIAVLVGSQTTSAGEITLIGLMSLPNTRTFGQPTAGFTVGNQVLPLLDGTGLALASGASIDPEGNVFTGPIDPDVEIRSLARGHALSNDDTIVAATEWLLQQPTCHDATPVAGGR